MSGAGPRTRSAAARQSAGLEAHGGTGTSRGFHRSGTASMSNSWMRTAMPAICRSHAFGSVGVRSICPGTRVIRSAGTPVESPRRVDGEHSRSRNVGRLESAECAAFAFDELLCVGGRVPLVRCPSPQDHLGARTGARLDGESVDRRRDATHEPATAHDPSLGRNGARDPIERPRVREAVVAGSAGELVAEHRRITITSPT